MKTGAVIQARMGSSRLPGKVLLPLGDTTVLEYVLKRVRKATKLDEIIVATTEHSSDDVISDLCYNLQVRCFRGPEHDVMMRYLLAAEYYQIDDIVRITSDCPFIDPGTIDEIIDEFQVRGVDYVLKVKMPVGTTSEIFSFQALKKAESIAKEKYHREHIVTAFTDLPQHFHSYIYDAVRKHNFPELRLTLDTEDDYRLIQLIYNTMQISRLEMVELEEIINFVEVNSDLLNLNAHIKPKNVEEINW